MSKHQNIKTLQHLEWTIFWDNRRCMSAEHKVSSIVKVTAIDKPYGSRPWQQGCIFSFLHAARNNFQVSKKILHFLRVPFSNCFVVWTSSKGHWEMHVIELLNFWPWINLQQYHHGGTSRGYKLWFWINHVLNCIYRAKVDRCDKECR